jgi:hypothetical protein
LLQLRELLNFSLSEVPASPGPMLVLITTLLNKR